MRSCALRILDAATISIAFVILRVFSTDLILPRISFPTAMTVLLGRVSWWGGSGERLLERGDGAAQLVFGSLAGLGEFDLLGLVGVLELDVPLRAVLLHRREQRGVVGLQVLVQAVLEGQHLLDRQRVHE